MKFSKFHQKVLISLVLVFIAVYINRQYLEKWIVEGFRQGRKFFWGYNPTTRNQSYDIRGDEDARVKYNSKQTGAFNHSGIHPNYQ